MWLTFSIVECGGYYFRTRSHDNMRQTLPFILQYLLILCAPPLLAATIYMSPGRILRAMKVEEVSLISPRWQTKLFVLVDLVCFATQFAGVIMSGSTDSDEASRGKTIIMVGLVVQVLSFGVYIIALFTAQVRLRQMQTAVLGGPELHWGRYFCALYVASGLFLIRNAVRIIEEKQGSDSPISKNEGYLYGLDALFMFAVAVIIIFLHPGRLIRKANKVSKASYLESGLAMEQSI